MQSLYQKATLSDLRTHAKPDFGSQIRSYVLHPYKMVKDHRTKAETTQAEDLLAGDLDKFIKAELE
jgi:peptide chain release factor 2